VKKRSLTWKKVLPLLTGLFLAPALMYAAGSVDVSGASSSPSQSSCMKCHGSTPEYPILGARMGYDTSGHKRNGNSAYANGGGCQQCHTNEGFIEYVAKGKTDPNAFVEYPSQQSCFTCHAPHETGTMSLRTVAAVKTANGSVFDLGSGNLCANCHQARSVATDLVKPMAANTISAPWGAHHGPQADMILGTNAYQDPRKSYATSPHKLVVKDGCVSCHMSLPQGRYGFSPSVGGHSFNISGDVHEAEKLNTSGCVTCHKDITQAVGTHAWSKAGGAGVVWIEKPAVFGIKAKADYDQDGKAEMVQDEVQGLLDRLVNKSGTGLLQTAKPPFYDATGAYVGNQTKENLPLEKVAALYNYKFVLEDRSRGVHNATYTFEVLYDTIAILDPSFDVSRRP
jgi:hypothetical protein